jgi:hypothetical protein
MQILSDKRRWRSGVTGCDRHTTEERGASICTHQSSTLHCTIVAIRVLLFPNQHPNLRRARCSCQLNWTTGRLGQFAHKKLNSQYVSAFARPVALELALPTERPSASTVLGGAELAENHGTGAPAALVPGSGIQLAVIGTIRIRRVVIDDGHPKAADQHLGLQHGSFRVAADRGDKRRIEWVHPSGLRPTQSLRHLAQNAVEVLARRRHAASCDRLNVTGGNPSASDAAPVTIPI